MAPSCVFKCLLWTPQISRPSGLWSRGSAVVFDEHRPFAGAMPAAGGRAPADLSRGGEWPPVSALLVVVGDRTGWLGRSVYTKRKPHEATKPAQVGHSSGWIAGSAYSGAPVSGSGRTRASLGWDAPARQWLSIGCRWIASDRRGAEARLAALPCTVRQWCSSPHGGRDPLRLILW